MYWIRPPETMSATAISSASRIGSWRGTSSAEIMIGIADVLAAIAAATVIGEGR